MKRPRGGTPNSTASDSEDDGTPSAKRTKLAPGPSALTKTVVTHEESDEDEEMLGSKTGSVSAVGGENDEDEDEDDEDEDDDGDEDDGSSAAEGLGDSDDDSDDSEDDDFLNELSAASDGPG